MAVPAAGVLDPARRPAGRADRVPGQGRVAQRHRLLPAGPAARLAPATAAAADAADAARAGAGAGGAGAGVRRRLVRGRGGAAAGRTAFGAGNACERGARRLGSTVRAPLPRRAPTTGVR